MDNFTKRSPWPTKCRALPHGAWMLHSVSLNWPTSLLTLRKRTAQSIHQLRQAKLLILHSGKEEEGKVALYACKHQCSHT